MYDLEFDLAPQIVCGVLCMLTALAFCCVTIYKTYGDVVRIYGTWKSQKLEELRNTA